MASYGRQKRDGAEVISVNTLVTIQAREHHGPAERGTECVWTVTSVTSLTAQRRVHRSLGRWRGRLDLSVTKAESVGGLDTQEQRRVINLPVLEVTWDAL